MNDFVDKDLNKIILNNKYNLICISDTNGEILQTNSKLNQILGYEEGYLKHKNIQYLFPEKYSKHIREKYNHLIGSGQKELKFKLPFQTNSGKFIPVASHLFFGKWNEKNVVLLIAKNLGDISLEKIGLLSVFNDSHILMAVSSYAEGVFMDVNQTFCRVLGYSKDEIIGRTGLDLNIFIDFNLNNEALSLYGNDKKDITIETILKTKNGELLNFLLSFETVKIREELFLFTSATNITQQIVFEDQISQLLDQEKLLSEVLQLLNTSSTESIGLHKVLSIIGEHTDVSRVYIFEDSPDGIYTSNTYEWCNSGILPQIKELQNLPYEIIPSWKRLLLIYGRIFSRNIKNLPEDLYTLLAPQNIKSILVYPLIVNDNFLGFVGFDECKKNRIWKNEEVELLKTISNVLANSMERIRYFNELETSELRLKLAMEGAQEGLWDWNNKNGEIYFSESWYRLLNIDSENFENTYSNWTSLIHPDDIDRVKSAINNHLSGDSMFYESTHRVKTGDNEWKWIFDHGKVVQRSIEGEALRTIGTYIDFTKQKQTEEHLTELIDMKNKMFSIIAHDLRGPMGSFLPVLDFLTNGEMLSDEDKNRFLTELKKSAIYTFNLLENLLNWSMCQTNNLKLSPQFNNLNEIFEEAINTLKSNANYKNIQLIINFEENCSTFFDKNTMSVVVRNILSNSIKFTPNGGTISINIHKTSDNIEAKISDTGIGMAKDLIENLMKNSGIQSTRGTNNEKGSGLGLFLVKDFIEKNNGIFNIQSKKGEGTTVLFSLPLISE